MGDRVKSWPAKLWARVTGKPLPQAESSVSAKETEGDATKSEKSDDEAREEARAELAKDPRMIGFLLFVLVVVLWLMFGCGGKTDDEPSEPDLEKGEGGI